MDETAVPARVTKSVTVAVIRQCHKHPRDGDGGHFAVVTEDGFTIRIEDIKCDGVIVCSANAQHKSSRLANSILDAVGFSDARRMVDWPAR
ncbi:hypothetical protein, partial [Ensifer sp. SSB1]|uniref:hypothetical protein n=1 Tax=Ensifer sp. SSB1 TaxID=2795385 RepID=UPI0025C51782